MSLVRRQYLSYLFSYLVNKPSRLQALREFFVQINIQVLQYVFAKQSFMPPIDAHLLLFRELDSILPRFAVVLYQVRH